MLLGIVLGLVAAFFQSCSYVFSKRFVMKFKGANIQLLVGGHIFMGLFSCMVLPFFWQKSMPPVLTIAKPLLLCVLFYLCGQATMFKTLASADASRVSPLLGLKILVLAFISVCITHGHFQGLQWVAIGLAVIAALLLSFLGKKMPRHAWVWIIFACVFYSLSDIFVRQTINVFPSAGLFHAAVLTASLCYLVCGAAAVAALPFYPMSNSSQWKAAFPFAFFWFAGMLFLFSCFGSIGVVFGNIVQSTRGILSIFLGSYIAFKGYEHLEEKVSAKITIFRVCAASLMMSAIALFYWGRI